MHYLIDSHCHIHDRSSYNFALSRQQVGKKLLKQYPDLPHNPTDFSPEKLIVRAHAAGVQKMICIGTSHEDSLEACDFATTHAKDGVLWSYGIHPDEAESGESPIVRSEIFTKVGDKASTRELALSRPVAIGEVGLDYRNGQAKRKQQIALFEQMLQLASDLRLPLIFHIRDAFDDFFAILANFPALTGVVHSFSDSPENLKKSLNYNFYVGVNGLATFAEHLPLPPLEKMLLETDAPFLTPVPFRGTINEPAHIKDICAYISKITGESEAQVAEVTTKNAERLFQI